MEIKSSNAHNPDAENLSGLQNILQDISNALHFQVLGNCDVLKRVRRIDAGEQDIAIFSDEKIECLIRDPVRKILGRLNGLKGRLNDLERVISSRNKS